MSTKSSASLAVLSVELRPSRWLRLILLAAAAAAITALSLAALPWPLRLLAGIAALVYLLTLASDHTGWPRPMPWCALRWDGNRWLLRHQRAGWLPAELRESVVWPGVTALRFRGPGRRTIRILLLADAVTAAERRRVHLHLRILSVHGPRRGTPAAPEWYRGRPAPAPDSRA